MNNLDPLVFIGLIRESFDGAKMVYTQGSCYQFYKILKAVYPDAEAYYDMNHVITKIDGMYYDITFQFHYGAIKRSFSRAHWSSVSTGIICVNF